MMEIFQSPATTISQSFRNANSSAAISSFQLISTKWLNSVWFTLFSTLLSVSTLCFSTFQHALKGALDTWISYYPAMYLFCYTKQVLSNGVLGWNSMSWTTGCKWYCMSYRVALADYCVYLIAANHDTPSPTLSWASHHSLRNNTSVAWPV